MSGRPKFAWPPSDTHACKTVPYLPFPSTSSKPTLNTGPQVTDPPRRERPRSLYSSFPISTSAQFQTASILSSTPPLNPNTATFASSFTQHSTSQQSKVPPITAPKPQINPSMWTTGPSLSSGMIPGPGQSSIPGSRPAPRRGRGLLKPQITGSSIPICGTCGSPIR